MVAPTPWHRRFEALVSVGPSLLDGDAAACVAAGLDAGLVLAVVAHGPVDEGAVDLPPAPEGRAPLLLGSADGPDRLVLGPDGVRRERAPVPPRAADGIVRARQAVLADLQELGLPVVELPGPGNGCAAALRLSVTDGDGDEEGHLRHVLAAAGLSGQVALADRVSMLARATFEDVHVRFDGTDIVLSAVETGDALRWVLAELADLGIGPSDVLVVTEGAPDGSLGTASVVEGEATPVVAGTSEAGSMADVVAAQVRHRERATLPRVAPAPGWRLDVSGADPERERARSVLVSLADGRVGIGGAAITDDPSAGAWTLVAGVYDGEGPETHLLPGPVATHLPHRLDPTTQAQRTLDLRTGVLHERVGSDVGPIDSVRFTSLRRPGTVVLRATGPVAPPAPPAPPLQPPPGRADVATGEDGDVAWMQVPATSGGIVAAATEAVTERPGAVVLDRIAAYVGGPDAVPAPGEAVARARDAAARGFDRLLGEHRAAWAARWREADVEIDGDDDLQLAVRFSLFHLMGSAADEGEAAVGARGLTGHAYRGHVFWDSDTFVLPFLAATHPPAARAMLEYRIRRLDAALDQARRAGRRGARFPWESARTGEDVTPRWVRDRSGRVVPIRTGQLEEHIVGQVAWAACTYEEWTGDEDFARGPGLRLLVETARYWTSRVRRTPDGRGHILGVIGPDEYHEPVDDNAFTNVLARWNLRRAAGAVEAAGSGAHGTTPEELASWREVAGALVDGYHPSTGIYEQCAGFFDLEPLLIAEVAPRRPIVADLLLGRERVSGAQIVKQADVLMLHHLVPDEVAPGSLEPNLRFYEPRTAHGSSLSPAVHAGLFARVRDFDRALDALRLAARIDLDDLTLTTAGGLHLATMGGLWQALAFGFAGLRPRDGWLRVDPRLPLEWAGLGLRVRYRGSLVRVRIERDRLHLSADRPARLEVDGRTYTADRGGLELRRRGPTWEVPT